MTVRADKRHRPITAQPRVVGVVEQRKGHLQARMSSLSGSALTKIKIRANQVLDVVVNDLQHGEIVDPATRLEEPEHLVCGQGLWERCELRRDLIVLGDEMMSGLRCHHWQPADETTLLKLQLFVRCESSCSRRQR